MCLTYNHGDRYLFCLIFLPLNMQIPFIPWISLETKMLPLISLQMLAFLGTLFTIILPRVASVSVQFRSKERGTRVKDCAKNGASKRAGRGWGRKQGFNACRQTPWFWKPPTWSVSCMSSRTDIWCCQQLSYNWPIKCLSFQGAEMNFQARVWNQNNFFFVFWNAWTALMVKSQWIQTINAGQLAQLDKMAYRSRHGTNN